MEKFVCGKAINGMAIHFAKDNAPETSGFTFSKCDASLEIKIDPDFSIKEVTCARCKRFKVYKEYLEEKRIDQEEAEKEERESPSNDSNRTLSKEEWEAMEKERLSLDFQNEEFDKNVSMEEYLDWLSVINDNKTLRAFCEKNVIPTDNFTHNFLKNKSETKIFLQRVCLTKAEIEEMDAYGMKMEEWEKNKERDNEREIPVVEKESGEKGGFKVPAFLPAFQEEKRNGPDTIISYPTFEETVKEIKELIKMEVGLEIKEAMSSINSKFREKETILSVILENISETVGCFNTRIEKIERALAAMQLKEEKPNFVELPSYKDELKEARKNKKRIMQDNEDHFELVKIGERLNILHVPSGQYMFSNIVSKAAETVLKYLNNLNIKWGNPHTHIPEDFVPATVAAFRAAYSSHFLKVSVAPSEVEEKPKRVLKRRAIRTSLKPVQAPAKKVLKRRVKK